MYPQLYAQIIRKVNYDYVNKEGSRQPFIHGLVYRCCEMVKAFLELNLARLDSHSMSRWSNNLQKVFDFALQLYLQVALLDPDISFQWLRFGASFDLNSMTAYGAKESETSGVVRAALFPHLINKGKIVCGKEQCVLRGVVYLQ